ncbi:TPA: hypothetical protein ACH3X2_003730 [Trebouxia sp. C0005]|nr:MAG: hypothetical protein FRX49_12646 [Trebouxia sp. A1-2]
MVQCTVSCQEQPDRFFLVLSVHQAYTYVTAGFVEMPLFEVVQYRLQGLLKQERGFLTTSEFRTMLHNAVTTISLAQLAHPHPEHLAIADHLTVLGSGSWPRLTSLNLSGLGLDSRSVAQLAKGAWPMLAELNISRTTLNAAALWHITQTPLPQLERLDLSFNWLDDEAVLQLVAADWPKLQWLNLRFNFLRANGTHALALSRWPLLKHLNLRSNLITHEATWKLAHANWPALEELDLSANPAVDIPGLVQGHWLQLQSLTVDSSVLSQDAVALLMRKWSRLHIKIKGKKLSTAAAALV